jgi:hypothetical protein
MTQNASIYSGPYQPTELNVFNLHERKAWTKPEIREINFNKTASGPTGDNDGSTRS